MRVIQVLFFFTFCSLPIVSAQTITGKVTTFDEKPLESVNIQLIEFPDSVFKMTTTNNLGVFAIEFSVRKNYLLKFSHIGYRDVFIELNDCQESVDLDTILMEEEFVNLNEFVVETDRRIKRIDKQIIFLTQTQRETSFSGYEILNKLALPGIKMDENFHTISNWVSSGIVQLRINNVIASDEEIIALNPNDLLRIEYIENPGVRYGENVGSVINFIIKRHTSGWVMGVNLTNAATTGYGDDNIYLKFNRKQSEFGFYYAFGYKQFDKIVADESDNYLLPNNTIYSVEKKGIASAYESQEHNAQLNYSLYNPEHFIFNTSLHFVTNNNPVNRQNQKVFETNKDDYALTNDVKDNYYSPSIDLYYQLMLPGNQNITANMVATYINSDYAYSQKEFDLSYTNKISEYPYVMSGEKKSLIAEAIYEKGFNTIHFSSGLQFTRNYLENQYENSQITVSEMNNSNFYVYSQLKGQVKQLDYMLGLGASKQNNRQNLDGYSYFTFHPSISISYPVFRDASLSYRFNVKTNLPKLTNLSDVRLQKTNFEYVVGNPNLKPFRNLINNLTFNFQKSNFYTQISTVYMSSKNAVMPIIERKTDNLGNVSFEFGAANQKAMNQLVVQSYMQYDVVPNKLTLSGNGGINRFLSLGNNYTRTYTAFFGGLQAVMYMGNWNISGNIDSRYKSLFGETIWYNEPSSSLNLNYQVKNIQFGVSWIYPLQNNGLNPGEVLSNHFVNKETWSQTKDYGNMILLHFVWNINSGRKYQNVEKIITNSDKDTGVIK
jgi:hypothetical protein